MNQQIKEQWVAALLSGEYQQTKNVLHDSEGFCCLGVLADLYLKETGGLWESDGRHNYIFPDYWDKVLPEEVVKWAGLNSDNPEVIVERYNHTTEEFTLCKDQLSDLNDTDHTFKMIAALIEEQL